MTALPLSRRCGNNVRNHYCITLAGRPDTFTDQAALTHTKHPSPGGNGDIVTHLSDRQNVGGGRDKRINATMATRIAKGEYGCNIYILHADRNAVRVFKARYEYFAARLHNEDRMADPSADDAFEKDFARMIAANQAWRDAEQRLLFPSSASSPNEPGQASTTLRRTPSTQNMSPPA
jgi:hypothetical protein